jgi:hypothetical protein
MLKIEGLRGGVTPLIQENLEEWLKGFTPGTWLRGIYTPSFGTLNLTDIYCLGVKPNSSRIEENYLENLMEERGLQNIDVMDLLDNLVYSGDILPLQKLTDFPNMEGIWRDPVLLKSLSAFRNFAPEDWIMEMGIKGVEIDIKVVLEEGYEVQGYFEVDYEFRRRQIVTLIEDINNSHVNVVTGETQTNFYKTYLNWKDKFCRISDGVIFRKLKQEKRGREDVAYFLPYNLNGGKDEGKSDKDS